MSMHRSDSDLNKYARDAKAQAGDAWRRDDLENENENDHEPINGTGVTQASAKAAAAKTQAEWNERAKPTPNRDRLAEPRKLEPWERETDIRSDARDEREDAVPEHVRKQVPAGMRAIPNRELGGWKFVPINGTRADAKATRVTRQG